MTPAVLLDRITGGRGDLAVRYAMVSVVGVVTTQALLFLLIGVLDNDPTWSNVIGVSVCSLPVFLLNKHWVWNHDGKLSLRREVLPFWVFTLAGLLISTLLVSLAQRISEAAIIAMAANISGFGVLWVAKFLFLDRVMFGHSEVDEILSQEDHPDTAAVDPV